MTAKEFLTSKENVDKNIVDIVEQYANIKIEKIKEYLFNTENHIDKENDFYISPEYLQQTMEFLKKL